MPVLLLSGCDNAAPTAQDGVAAGKQGASAIPQGSRQSAMPALIASRSTDPPATVRMLFEEVKRLNAACVDAGGGVSGSPDCDLAQAREEELEGLGYCIDYLNGETLISCPAPGGADG